LGGLLITLASLINIPGLEVIGNWLVDNAAIILPAVFAIFGGLRMITKGKSKVTLVK